MFQFTLFETQSCSSVQLAEANSATLLSTMNHLHWTDADLLQDGEYAFSLRRIEAGYWILYRRDQHHVTSARRTLNS